jgi:heptosyltransferase-2
VTTAERILIVGPSWVGDMVMAQSLYRLLRQRKPESLIHVLAPAWSLPLLARMPEVNQGIELPLGHGELGWGIRRRLGQTLRDRYERAIVLPRSLKSALVPWFAQIPIRTGFRGEWRYGLINDLRPFDKASFDQTVKRIVALGLARGEMLPTAIPEPALATDAAGTAAACDRLGLAHEEPIIAMMPGAEYGPAKQWPVDYFSRLARELAASAAQVWIFGSAKEAALGDAIAAGADAARVRNLCGETSLVEAVDLLALADVAVSNDSGLMHIAAAVGTHVVALYGSSTPAFTPPLTDKSTVHYRALDCSPCFKRECPLGHLDCLRGIEVADVAASVVRALAARAAAG